MDSKTPLSDEVREMLGEDGYALLKECACEGTDEEFEALMAEGVISEERVALYRAFRKENDGL